MYRIYDANANEQQNVFKFYVGLYYYDIKMYLPCAAIFTVHTATITDFECTVPVCKKDRSVVKVELKNVKVVKSKL